MKAQEDIQENSVIQQQITKQQQLFNLQMKTKTKINLDCIKVCPMNRQIWAFAFYQQHPQFCGGIQIINTNQILNKKQSQQSIFGTGSSYIQMGPLMHIQWFDTQKYIKNTKQYYILAAARCDQAIIIKYTIHTKSIQQIKRIKLGSSIFCLYCDWQIIKQHKYQQIQKINKIQVIAAVSTSQSAVYAFQVFIDYTCQQQNKLNQIQISQIQQYNKHEYAVWACKVNTTQNGKIYMVTGDQVDCLYLYDLKQKKLLAKNKTAHTQGICQIIWKNQNTIISGSFDGSIAEICIDNFSQTLKRLELGGTIWRIIPLNILQPKFTQNLFFICNSSQKKFQIVNYQRKKIAWDSCQEHTSLAYSADFNGKFIITVSFYDQQARIWSVNLK